MKTRTLRDLISLIIYLLEFPKSLNLSKDSKFKWNSSFGVYYKIPTYTSLGFKNTSGIFINRRNKYTKSEHVVTGFDYGLGAASKISIEGFLKKYSQYPISVIDGVSLANKGADFEVLGNEEIVSNGVGAVSYTHLTLPTT